MTLAQLKTKANAKLTEFWTELSAKEDIYFAKHGKYFQLCVTQGVTDGVDSVFTVIKPTDERHVVDVDFTFNSPIPFQISVDEWVSGHVKGYSATATVTLLTGVEYERTHHSDGTDSGWSKVIPKLT